MSNATRKPAKRGRAKVTVPSLDSHVAEAKAAIRTKEGLALRLASLSYDQERLEERLERFSEMSCVVSNAMNSIVFRQGDLDEKIESIRTSVTEEVDARNRAAHEDVEQLRHLVRGFIHEIEETQRQAYAHTFGPPRAKKSVTS